MVIIGLDFVFGWGGHNDYVDIDINAYYYDTYLLYIPTLDLTFTRCMSHALHAFKPNTHSFFEVFFFVFF